MARMGWRPRKRSSVRDDRRSMTGQPCKQSKAISMNHEVIVTCAVTGAGDTVGKHPAIPVTPKEIAAAAIEVAKAGATVAHCPVRAPQTGRGSRDPYLYREVVERFRCADTDVIINLTAGMGGDLEIGAGEEPMRFGQGTDLVGGVTRLGRGGGLRAGSCT